MWVRHGHGIYLGPPPGGDVHSTSIAQLLVGVDAPVQLRVDGLPDITARSILIPARVAHQVHSTGNRVLLCYFDPTSTQMARCLGGMRAEHGPFGIGHPHEDRLLEACDAAALNIDAVLDLASIPTPRISDPRITLVAKAIRSEPARQHRAADTADILGISRSHFLRLFASQTSTSFRRYVQWARMLAVANSVANGQDLTSSATAAGFSSPSHFSDVFRGMFGLTPSAMLASNVQIRVLGD